VQPNELRIALFSGNYNYHRDGANQALNRLVGYLLRQGANVRVYSPTTATPAFEPTGDLVSVPSIAVPGREEYRLGMCLCPGIQRDLAKFDPNIVHIAAPDIVGHRAVTWARKHRIPAVASVHTRFETYLTYYRLQWFEPLVRVIMRRLYRRCEAVLVPAESMAAVLRAQRMNREIGIWARGIDREQFNPDRRDMNWRRGLGISGDEMVVAFLGRVVMEKGLDIFVESIQELEARGVSHRVLVIGEGPARAWFEQQLPKAIFLGHQEGPDLARALASSDVLLNPSVTEAFGNVTLEAMACALPVVAAESTGATNLVHEGETGMLIAASDIDGFADALAAYAADPALRHRHGEGGLAFARTMDWDAINAAVIRVYRRAVEKRMRLTRLSRKS